MVPSRDRTFDKGPHAISFLVLELMAEIWDDHDMSEDRMTPRYLNSLTWFTIFPVISSGATGRVGDLFREKSRWQHFR